MTTPTIDELTKDIEDTQADLLPDQVSMDKLTLHYIANRTWATQLNKCYQEIEDVLAKIDILRASSEDLERLVVHALPGGRYLGDYASGYVTFISDYPATEAITIPAGTVCYAILETSSKLKFTTTESVEIGISETEATAACIASERGPDYNVAAYAIIQVETYVFGISSCENRLAITGGTLDESDEDLLQRYYDAIAAPGKATAFMIERALMDVENVKEVKIDSYGQGDIGVVVDYSGGIEEVSEDIVNCLQRNKSCGIQSRGCLGATIDGATAVVTSNDCYGGLVWVRPRNHIAAEDTFTLTYYDMTSTPQTATVVIPAGTHRGEMVAATMLDADSRAKRIETITPSGNNSYDILIGMGEADLLYNLPELISVNITAHVYLTSTPEADLLENIEASLSAFIDALRIGERIEFSDIQRFMFNLFDQTQDDDIGRPFLGIDEIADLSIEAGGVIINGIGERLEIEEDGRFEPGTISILLGA